MGKFLAKWILNGILAAPLLMWFAGVSFISAVVAASVLSVAAWFAGDKAILPATNNVTASIMDAVLAAVYFLLVAFLFRWDLGFGEIAVISVILAVAEFFFHRYVLRNEELAAA